MNEQQVRTLATAAVVLWARRAVHGPDDDGDREFQRAVAQVLAEMTSE